MEQAAVQYRELLVIFYPISICRSVCSHSLSHFLIVALDTVFVLGPVPYVTGELPLQIISLNPNRFWQSMKSM